MSERTYETRPNGSDSWQPVTYEAMIADLGKYTAMIDNVILKLDRGSVIQTPNASYRKASSDA